MFSVLTICLIATVLVIQRLRVKPFTSAYIPHPTQLKLGKDLLLFSNWERICCYFPSYQFLLRCGSILERHITFHVIYFFNANIQNKIKFSISSSSHYLSIVDFYFTKCLYIVRVCYVGDI